MLFKIGDHIVFKKEKQSGVVVSIESSHKVVIKDNKGLKIPVLIKDILLVDHDTNTPSAYGVSFPSKDTTDVQKISKKNQKTQSVVKIDLHIEGIFPEHHFLENYEIVQMQLKVCQEKIERVINTRVNKLIIVHGIGTGVLRSEVHKMLQSYKLRYVLTKDCGATEVILQ